ncbi:MAG: valine--tRNA ligase [Acidobacteriota bacterium]
MKKDIPKAYEAAEVEEKWYRFWLENGFFSAHVDSGKAPFSIVLPPPNVTGSLHMGHALNVTLQDILVRWKRMKGFNVLWVPGTDHAGIATQNVVERQLAEKQLHRKDLGRRDFEKLVWEWKEKAEQDILNQIRRLGCSCDWSRTRFTLDEGLSRAVREVFVRLHESGLIYRGEYLVNWCPRCSTAISDLEVEHQPSTGHLWYFKYPLADGDGFVVVATTRPETMLGDTAVAVHPADERYQNLPGRTVVLPLMNREIPVIADSFVQKDFGTGAVKVTPGHDPNDFEAGKRHGLPIFKVIGPEGRMTAEAGKYEGLDRYQARERVLADLTSEGLLWKVEDHQLNLGLCQRCDTIIEPLVSTQWFVKVKPLAEVAVEAVKQKRTVFIPENYEKVFFEWMGNIHDWCVSRQLWWGHRIPAWYCGDCGEMTVSRETPTSCPHCSSDSLEQESDVLDTWFSSALWPFSTLGWPDSTPELSVYYPTSTLVTGFDIIFFWVARMMMMGLRFMDDVPFRAVHINGLVRDEKGRKMSKSRGNVIDPVAVVDEYGADAIRFTLSAMAVPGTDIPFSVSRMSGYRAFCNKIWNAGRFLLLNLEEVPPVTEAQIQQLWERRQLELEDRWILGRLQKVIRTTEQDLERFRFHEASNELYHFFWHRFCDWYIELIKPEIIGGDSERRQGASLVALYVLDQSLRLLHPFVPFVSEELWQRIPHSGSTLMLATFPEPRQEWISETDIEKMESLQDLISTLRTTRTENKIEPRKKVSCQLVCDQQGRAFLESELPHLKTLARLDQVEFVDRLNEESLQLRGTSPLAEFSLLLDGLVNLQAERQRLGRQISRLQEEVCKLETQLENASFLDKAPASVVEGVRNRHAEAVQRLNRLKTQMDGLS